MKKLLLLLFCLPLIFSNCEQNTPSPAPPPAPLCGTISFDVNGVTQTTNGFIPIANQCTEVSIIVINGLYVTFGGNFYIFDNNNNVECSVVFMITDYINGIASGQTYTAGTAGMGFLLQYHDYLSSGTIGYSNTDLSSMIVNGSITITSLDVTNNLVSGNFEFDGYNTNFLAIHITNGVFTNVPASFQYK